MQIGWRVIGSYIKSGSLLLFLLTILSHLGLIGSQAMANIWLCMWTDNVQCMPANWGGGQNATTTNHTAEMSVDMKVTVYGIIGCVEGLSQSVFI